MGTITTYITDGTLRSRSQVERPTLAELQAEVGGYICAVDAYMPDGSEAYANDEGMINDMDPNIRGSLAVRWPHVLYGPIVVLAGFPPEVDED